MPIYKTSQFTGTSLYDDAQDIYGLNNKSSIKSKTIKSQNVVHSHIFSFYAIYCISYKDRMKVIWVMIYI